MIEDMNDLTVAAIVTLIGVIAGMVSFYFNTKTKTKGIGRGETHWQWKQRQQGGEKC